jgi:hypothetical protein
MNSTSRNGFVRVTNSAVYKGVDAHYQGHKVEYEVAGTHNFAALAMFLVPALAIVGFIFSHM